MARTRIKIVIKESCSRHSIPLPREDFKCKRALDGYKYKSPDYSSALTYKVFSIRNKLYTQDPLVKRSSRDLDYVYIYYYSVSIY